ncbi:aldo/keto reductase [Tundrisphaera lichenicola]|uniref:aldo/keto reductase n=1 Tax=Tundrisphaera lichenicola TaxID=2029860 RepID=UPI003EC0AB12
MNLNRREFLGSAAAAGMAVASSIGAADDPSIPLRSFGKTGLTVSSLGFGSGSRFLMYEREDQALEALSRAIDLGITYIDTAHAYGNGKSEERIGRLMPDRRKQVTLATKINARKADDARRQIELSLERLQVDQLDVLHIHDLKSPADLAAIEAPDGVLKVLYEARDQKLARFIGITCHADPSALALALERHDFDATQMALNAGFARMDDAPGGMKATLMPRGNFEELALPVAVRKRMGVIAMKVFGQGQIVDAAPIEKLLTYSLSLPVSLASCGMPRPEFIEQNARIARQFRPMSVEDRRVLSDSIAAAKKVAMREFFADHEDA